MTPGSATAHQPLTVTTINCGFDNFSYLLTCNETGQAAIVDPTEAYPVWREVEAAGVELTAVLCTHHHHDHIGGLEDLLTEQPELVVYGHELETSRIPGLTHPLAGGAEITMGRLEGRVLHTPGHTRGSVCYRFGDSLFTGDTLFGAGCGRLFEGTAAQMYRSLNEVIGCLPESTRLYFGHEYTAHNLGFAATVEPENEAISRRLEELQLTMGTGGNSTPSSLYLEKATNPFFRCHLPGLHKQLAGEDANVSESEIFARLRELRNSY